MLASSFPPSPASAVRAEKQGSLCFRAISRDPLIILRSPDANAVVETADTGYTHTQQHLKHTHPWRGAPPLLLVDSGVFAWTGHCAMALLLSCIGYRKVATPLSSMAPRLQSKESRTGLNAQRQSALLPWATGCRFC